MKEASSFHMRAPKVVRKGGKGWIVSMITPGNRLEMCTVCVGYDCFEEKSGSLGLHIRRELVELVNTLQYDEKDGLKNNDCLYSGDSESDS